MGIEVITCLADILKTRDSNGDGVLTRQEMLQCVDDLEFMDLLADVGLPKGFTIVDLHTMLDADGSGTLCSDEFVTGISRLITGTPFQHACVFQRSMSELRAFCSMSAAELTKS